MSGEWWMGFMFGIFVAYLPSLLVLAWLFRHNGWRNNGDNGR